MMKSHSDNNVVFSSKTRLFGTLSRTMVLAVAIAGTVTAVSARHQQTSLAFIHSWGSGTIVIAAADRHPSACANFIHRWS